MTPHPKPQTKEQKADPKYLDWLKTQPCCNPNCPGRCGDIVPAHQRILGRGGIGTKPPDQDALPLGTFCHDKEHEGAVTFWGQGTKASTKIFVQKLCNQHLEKYKQLQADATHRKGV